MRLNPSKPGSESGHLNKANAIYGNLFKIKENCKVSLS